MADPTRSTAPQVRWKVGYVERGKRTYLDARDLALALQAEGWPQAARFVLEVADGPDAR